MILKILKRIIPHSIKRFIIDQVDKNYRFKGWNLKTKNSPPWKYINKKAINNSQLFYFQELQNEFENLITDKKFISNQFRKNLFEKSRELMWRHYNVCLTIKMALSKIKRNISRCEVGVADGITTWFALRVLEKEKNNYENFWLYDSWEEMKKKYLNVNEYNKIGKFNSNDISTTKSNLNSFRNLKYVKGFVSDTFQKKENSPDICDWLHIDLNSSDATIETLNFFEPKMSNSSLILFDDFGWPSYETTRIEVEKWCLGKRGILWPLPTGQAIFFIDKN